MIAGVYARKSTSQEDIADEEKSVTRQVEHAKAYAARKGWTVAEEFIFIDDNVSGAEFNPAVSTDILHLSGRVLDTLADGRTSVDDRSMSSRI